jgi:serine phosphatase RsbU (regulator of sigma subunit)
MAGADLFIVVSDGVFEAENPAGEQMGVDRVLEILQEQRAKSAEEQLAAVRSGTAAFCEGVPPRDDQTIVLVRGR